jgi:hypothetical protein
LNCLVYLKRCQNKPSGRGPVKLNLTLQDSWGYPGECNEEAPLVLPHEVSWWRCFSFLRCERQEAQSDRGMERRPAPINRVACLLTRWGRREAATRSQRRASCRFCFSGGGIC